MPQTFLDRLQAAYPAETYVNTLRAIREGIATADDALKGVPFLASPVGKDIRGLVRRAGVFSRFHDLCKLGDLPFRAEFSKMPRGTWHWLDIWSGDAHGHIVRTEDADVFPEDTPNRQDQRAVNTGDLFDKKENVINLQQPKLYTWLCYKAFADQSLAHVIWQAPSAKRDGKEDEWLARINLLKVVAMIKPEETNNRAVVDPKTKLRLRDDIAASLKKDETQ